MEADFPGRLLLTRLVKDQTSLVKHVGAIRDDPDCHKGGKHVGVCQALPVKQEVRRLL